jgi:hypothetical protein
LWEATIDGLPDHSRDRGAARPGEALDAPEALVVEKDLKAAF